MPSWKRPLLTAIALMALIGVSIGADQRTWTDTTGKFKVEGKLVRATNVSVTLQQANGRLITIALAKLSPADRTYVKQELEASRKPKDPKGPEKPGEEDPFKPGETPGKPDTPAGKPGEIPGQEGPGQEVPGGRRPGLGKAGGMGRPGTPPAPGSGSPDGELGSSEPGVGGLTGKPNDSSKPAPSAVPATEVAANWVTDLTQAKSIGLGNVPEAFPLAVGAAPKMPKPASPDPVAIPAAPDFFDKISGLAISLPSGKAVLGRVNQRPASPDVFSRFYVCDLTGDKPAEPTRITGDYAPLALSDDGNTLLVRATPDGFGHSEKLEFWSIDGKFKRLAAFTPYEGPNKFDSAVQAALFAGPNRLVTANGAGTVAVWDIAKGAPVYQAAGQRSAAPALSPDRKLLAFATDQDVAICDLEAGRAVALLPIKSLGQARLAFSPDGKRLAHANGGAMTIFDLTTGQQEKSFEAAFINLNAAAFCWTDDGHVLAGDTVFSAEYGTAIWKYTGSEVSRLGSEYVYCVLNNRDRAPGALVPVLMPPARAIKQMEGLSRAPDFVILKPGSEIKIDTTGVADPLKQSQVRIALIKRAEAAGYQVSDDAKVSLKATTGFAKEQEVSYQPFGMPRFGGPFGRRGGSPEPQKLKVRPFYANLVIEYEGKTAWRTGSGGSPPHLIMLKEGETTESYLKKLDEPNYALFDQVKMPKKLNKPVGSAVGAGLGSSQITAAGAR